MFLGPPRKREPRKDSIIEARLHQTEVPVVIMLTLHDIARDSTFFSVEGLT